MRRCRAILSCAKKARLIDFNFATSDYIDSPKKPKERIKVMNDEEAKKFYATLLNYKDIRIKTSMLVFLLTGFRRGEVAGLEWQDIDFENETISIERTVNYTPVPITTVSSRAGHSRRSTTLDIYAGSLKTADESAAQAVDNFFNGKVDEEKKEVIEIDTKPEINEEDEFALLRKYKNLLDEGIIEKEDFDALKKKILGI